jgi:hypothetical protein
VNDVFNDKAWLDEFWGDSDCFTGPPLTDEMVRQAEQRFNYKLPAAYLRLLRLRNGGSPRRRYFHKAGLRGWDQGYFVVDSLRGIGHETRRIDADPGTDYFARIGLILCDTTSGGRDAVMLDYDKCGPKGEPRVSHVRQRCLPSGITALAPNFEAFAVALSAHPPGEADGG